MNSLLQAPINCLHFLAATVQIRFEGEQLFVSITQSLEEEENGKKKKIEELVVAFLPPLVPCCVGCDAVKDKGSAPGSTCPIPPIGMAVLPKPKIRTGNQSSLSLFTPS